DHFCRLIRFTESLGCQAAVPELIGAIEERPLLDFGAGDVKRYEDELPRQGAGFPWRLTQAYPVDARYLRHGRLDDPELRFFSAGAPAGAPEPATASASS
ncbi:MAG: FAD-containing monooxygenase EthA, partial [Solirubrobacterales bacterium]